MGQDGSGGNNQGFNNGNINLGQTSNSSQNNMNNGQVNLAQTVQPNNINGGQVQFAQNMMNPGQQQVN